MGSPHEAGSRVLPAELKRRAGDLARQEVTDTGCDTETDRRVGPLTALTTLSIVAVTTFVRRSIPGTDIRESVWRDLFGSGTRWSTSGRSFY